MAKIDPIQTLMQVVTSGGSQIFLGAPWVSPVIKAAPGAIKRRLALEFLAISPHYFFDTGDRRNSKRAAFYEAEVERNRESRREIIDLVVRSHIDHGATVLDYGCGPGFLAKAASRYAGRVVACDISTGVLACAAVLNGADNIDYMCVRNGKIPAAEASVDLIYSFAVVQHVGDAIFTSILREWLRVLKPSGMVLCHVVLEGAPGWRTETQWNSDRSLKGHARMALALHCFARSADRIVAMASAAGFKRAVIIPMADLGVKIDPDIKFQHLLTLAT